MDMQIDELDDQQCRHLHRSGAPQREGSEVIIQRIVWSEGSKAQAPRLLTASSGNLLTDPASI
uniref:Uncharacterized protein n=1 Tax=Romanomermis culicivorax TaxID=13658 RepID=A0A915IBR1_ROMCU